MATDNMRIDLLLTRTWPTSQNVKQPYLKLRLGGSAADCSACQTLNPAVPGLIPSLATC